MISRRGKHHATLISDPAYRMRNLGKLLPTNSTRRSQKAPYANEESRGAERKMRLDEYTVGWICALGHELAASRAMLDNEHEPLQDQDPHDHNVYSLGDIGGHNIVMACLPAGKFGTESAATVAKDMLRTFKSIRFGLLVGVGGGVPTDKNDIRLGDVVVSKPTNESADVAQQHGGVIQYDMGKVLPKGVFERRGTLNKPPLLLLNALNSLVSSYQIGQSKLAHYLSATLEKYPAMRAVYTSPGAERDKLYKPRCKHLQKEEDCAQCEHPQEVERKQRTDYKGVVNDSPIVHYGLIASGSKVIASAEDRDRIHRDAEILCIEMEAAGLMDIFPCLVIRGICDYADSYKQDDWQCYAALTAAAYTKELLYTIPRSQIANVEVVSEVAANTIDDYDFGLQLEEAPEIDDSNFVGRVQQIHDLAEYFIEKRSQSGQRSLVISGLGGIGKSQLALQFAKRHQDAFTSIFWLRAHSESTLRQSLLKIARRISEKFNSITAIVDTNREDQLVEQMRAWFSRSDNRRWLLIFDNHDDPEVPGKDMATAYNLKRYLPYRSQGSILVTTRRSSLNFGTVMQLRKLEQLTEALEILSRRSGRENVKYDSGAKSLATRLDGLPLALATAGDHLRQTPESFEEYFHDYEESWNDLEETADELPDYEGRTLYSTWNLSFARLKVQSPETAMILKFMAYLGNQEVWFELFQAAKKTGPQWMRTLANSKIKFGATMRKLQEYSLIEANYKSGTYSLHKCVHDWTLDHLNRQVDEELYALALHCISSLALPEQSPDYWQSDLRLEAHVVRLTLGRFQSVVEDELDEAAINKFHVLGQVLGRRDKLAEEERLYEWTVAAKERLYGREHSSTLETVSRLGDVYRARTKLVEAEKMCQRGLTGMEAILTADDPRTLGSVNVLGNLRLAQGKLGAAEELYDQAYTGMKKVYGSDHLITLKTLENLGCVYGEQGRLSEAEELFVRILRLREQSLGRDHASTLHLLKNLATLYKDQGKITEAEQMYERVVNKSGRDPTSTLDAANNLGALYADLGRFAEAEKIYHLALEEHENVLGTDHIWVLYTWSNLAEIYRRQEKLEEAQDVYEGVLTKREKTLGSGDLFTQRAEGSLRQVHTDQENLTKSAGMIERAFIEAEKLQPKDELPFAFKHSYVIHHTAE